MPFVAVTILTHVQNLMSTWGYPVLFGLLFGCGLGLPVPEDVPLLLAGYFVAIGKMNLAVAAGCAWLGIIGGDCVLYSLGRRFGMGITKVPIVGKHVTADRITVARDYFHRYGTWVVAVGRMFAGIRGAMVIAAGTIRFSFVRFLIADGLAAVVSGGLFIGLGYWAGRELGDLNALSEKIKHYERGVFICVAVLVIILLAWLWHRRKRRLPTVVEHALEKASHLNEHPATEPAASPASSSDVTAASAVLPSSNTAFEQL